MINKNLDTNALAAAFAVDKRLVIEDFLLPDVAERMHDAMIDSVPYQIHYVLDDKYQSLSREDAAKDTPEQQKTINRKILEAASRGVGFIYDGYLKSRVETGPEHESNEKLTFLHEVFDYIGSEEVLSTISKITGRTDLTGAEPQYTRFTPGHFLTRHRDVVTNERRRIAFVLGLTKGWHPDWGGLLQFYQEDGTPRDAWTPRFNVLSIFDVSHIHAVTYVAPYARASRYSLTGWFIDGR